MVPSLQVSIGDLLFQSNKSLTKYRANAEFVKKNGKRKAFHTGGNSSCRAHIRKHYELYKQRCKDGNIPENHHALPRELWKELQEAKKNPKAMQQRKLDGAFKAIKAPAEFTREGVLHAVARFVACDDQVRGVHSVQRSLRANTCFDSLGTGSRK
jgi:hypothetical protein